MPHIGFMVPSIAPDATPTSTVDFARRAEELGAHSVWVPAGVELLIVSSVTARLDQLDAFGERVLPRLT